MVAKNFGVGIAVKNNVDNEAELREAFAILSEDGFIVNPIGAVPWSPCCADVIDKFGISWWISI